MTEMLEWFRSALQSILDALNPSYWILQAVEQIAPMLPEPADTQSIFDTARSGLTFVAPYIRQFDYFINMPLFASAIGLMAVTEFGLMLFRTWRIARSVVT